MQSRCWQGHAHPEGSRGFFFALPSFWWLPAVLGVPWLVTSSLQSLPLSPCGLLPCDVICVCVCVLSPFYKDISHIGVRAPLISMTSFQLITLTKTLLPNKIILRGTSIYLFGGHNSTQNSVCASAGVANWAVCYVDPW